MILYQYHDTSWQPKIGRLRKCRLSKSMWNPKDNLVRMIRTMFSIGTIRKWVVSVLEVEVKLDLPINFSEEEKPIIFPRSVILENPTSWLVNEWCGILEYGPQRLNLSKRKIKPSENVEIWTNNGENKQVIYQT